MLTRFALWFTLSYILISVALGSDVMSFLSRLEIKRGTAIEMTLNSPDQTTVKYITLEVRP